MTPLELWLTVLCGVLLVLFLASSKKQISQRKISEKDLTEGLTNARTLLLKQSLSRSNPIVFRVRGTFSRPDLPAVLKSCLGPDCDPSVESFASQADESVNIATITLNIAPIQLLSSDQKTFDTPNVTIDTHFRGLSVLASPDATKCSFDIIAVCGLGGHAFGSFKERNGTHMWLRDSLPQDFVNARVLVYGYDSQIHGSNSFSTIESLASSLRNHVEGIKSLSGPLYENPIIFIAHSLGGLVLKQALIQSVKAKSKLARCTRGALFFGVPNQGMHMSSLIPMAAGQPNEALLHNLQQESELLRTQSRDFPAVFSSREARIFSFYETKTSPTAVRGADGEWQMNGDHVIFVGSASATHCRPWESEAHHMLGLNRDHSGIVKFEPGDQDYIKVRNVLRGIIDDQYKFPQPRPMISEMEQELTNQCLKAIGHTNPTDTMRRIEATKDDLVAECNDWIKSDPRLEEWKNDPQQRLLWLSGDPGKGKTMLMMFLIRTWECSNSESHSHLTFFFCQNTDPNLNTAHAVLRGLLWLLIRKNPILGRHLHEDFAHQKDFVDGSDAFVALCRITTKLLQDITLPTVYILIDALDECDEGRGGLLRFICENSASAQSKAKWLVSSRNHLDLEKEFKAHQHGVLSLELNATQISAAVEYFIDCKVNDLAKRNGYSDKLCERVQQHMMDNANSTFLWVALACKHLNNTARINVSRELAQLPAGLSSLYDHMLEQLRAGQDHELTTTIIRFVTIAKRPLLTEELLPLLVREKPEYSDEYFEDPLDNDDLLELIKSCGSFITVREGVIYLIHQSVKDYLLDGGKKIFSSRMNEEHCMLVDRALTVLSKELTKTMYAHDYLLHPTGNNFRPSKSLGYVSCFWVHHLAEYQNICILHLRDNLCYHENKVFEFIYNHFLQWMELLCLLGQLKTVPFTLGRLEAAAKRFNSEKVFLLSHDAARFLMHCYLAVEEDPSQIYSFGLIFAPEGSLIRQAFLGHMPSWITISSCIDKKWNQKQQSLHDHGGFVFSVAFSSDSRQLASASDGAVKLWDTVTGEVLLTLQEPDQTTRSVSFHPDSRQLATASDDHTVKLWDTFTGEKLLTLRGHTSQVRETMFSPNGKQLVSVSDDHKLRIWDTATGKHVRTFDYHTDLIAGAVFSLEGKSVATVWIDNTIRLWNIDTEGPFTILYSHSSCVWTIAFSPDGRQLASASADGKIGIWNNSTHKFSWLKGHTSAVAYIAFSPDGRQLASSSEDSTTRIWDTATYECLQTIEQPNDLKDYDFSSPLAFSPDSRQLAVLFGRNIVQLLDPETGEIQQTFITHNDYINFFVFSPDGRQLAIQSVRDLVELWDVAESRNLQISKTHKKAVCSIAFSQDGEQVVSGSEDGTIITWDGATGVPLETLEGHQRAARSVAFSSDGLRVASGSDDLSVRIWNTKNNQSVQTIENRTGYIKLVASSPDFQHLASVSDDFSINLWSIAKGKILQTYQGHTGPIVSTVFSPDSQYLASGSDDKTVRVWHVSKSDPLITLSLHKSTVKALAFRPDGKQLASGASNEVLLWDTEKWQIVRMFPCQYLWHVSIAFSPDCQKLAFLARRTELELWDTTSSGKLLELFDTGEKNVNDLTFSLDGQQLVVVFTTRDSHERQVQVWDIQSGELLNTLQRLRLWEGSVPFSSNGRYLLIVSLPPDDTPCFCDAITGHIVRKFRGLKNSLLAFSPDGQHLASWGYERIIYIWNTTTGKVSTKLQCSGYRGDFLGFSPNGEQLVSCSYKTSNAESVSICLWNLKTGESVWEFRSTILRIRSVDLSPNGQHLATASNDTLIRLWDVSSGKLMHILEGHTYGVCSVAFSPDGQQLASGSNDCTIRLWDVSTGASLKTLSQDTVMIKSVTFSLDGQQVISWKEDRTICCWTPASDDAPRMIFNQSAAQFWHLVRHGSDLVGTGITFDPDSNWLCFNGCRLIWLPQYLRPRVSAVHGSRIAIGCASGVVYILGFDVDQLIRA